MNSTEDPARRPLPKTKRLKGLVSRGIKPVTTMALLTLLVALSDLFQNVIFGEIVLVIYAVCALVFRIASVKTFQLSLAAFFFTFLTNTIDPSSALPETFAVYSYVLLVIGLLTTLVEQWKDVHAARKDKEKRKNLQTMR